MFLKTTVKTGNLIIFFILQFTPCSWSEKLFYLYVMEEESLLQEILNSIDDLETLRLFATANNLVGDVEIENRLRELQWDKHVDDLWQEVLMDLEPPSKRRKTQDEGAMVTHNVMNSVLNIPVEMGSAIGNYQHETRQEISMEVDIPAENEVNQPSTSSMQYGCGEEIEKPYSMQKISTRTYKKNLATDTKFELKFNDQWKGDKLSDIDNKLHDMFDDVLSEARGHNADLGRVLLNHPKLNNPIVVSLQPWDNLNADTVMSEITKVLNSNEDIPVDENLIITIGTINLPKGGGHNKKLPITQLLGPDNSLIKKHAVFHVENDDELCMAIAIGLCFLKTCKKVDAETWSNLVANESGATIEHALKHRCIPQCFYDNILKKVEKRCKKIWPFIYVEERV